RFLGGVLSGGQWTPMPSGVMASTEYENGLYFYSSDLAYFTTKHGTTMAYRAIYGLQNQDTGAGMGGGSGTTSFFRIESVTDSVGNKIVFEYPDDSGVHTRALASSIYHQQCPTRRINIHYDANNQVTDIWDPKGNVTQFFYTSAAFGGRGVR